MDRAAVTWWCAATGLPWAWEWRAYPGVWIFVALLAVVYSRTFRVAGHRIADRHAAFGIGLVWLALDWPLGALGGYLASAHTGQFILLALAAPPFLLLACRPALERAPVRSALRFLAHPLPAFAIYNTVMLITHIPRVVDALMPSQVGSLIIDLAWMAGGFALWWPAVAPARYRRLSPPLAMGYLFVQTIPAIFPAAALVFGSYPLYRLYELAPRVTPLLTPAYDHQIAGLLMKVVGDPIVWIGIAVIFFQWANAERRADLATPSGNR
ncbi:MAG: cytochrome c oxidase assembly protein [Gemmatimonadetes bacterium]|nr:cytochrome c oxidase assembly protein [Gemmatimonadota bacterium]